MTLSLDPCPDLTRPQLAARLGIATRTLDRWTAKYDVPHRVGSYRRILFRWEDVRSWLSLRPSIWECLGSVDTIRRLIAEGSEEKRALRQYWTPDDLADRMVQVAQVKSGMQVLEPSAGAGNIVRAIERAGGTAWCVEIDPRLMVDLITQDRLVIWGDFLGCHMTASFDAIVMNPPFHREIEHVEYAWRMLKPGGRLVAVMSRYLTDSRDAMALDSTRWIMQRIVTISSLPAGTFAASGSPEPAILVEMRKPEEARS